MKVKRRNFLHWLFRKGLSGNQRKGGVSYIRNWGRTFQTKGIANIKSQKKNVEGSRSRERSVSLVETGGDEDECSHGSDHLGLCRQERNFTPSSKGILLRLLVSNDMIRYMFSKDHSHGCVKGTKPG